MESITLNRRRLVWMFGASALLSSCGGGSDEPAKPPLPVGPPPPSGGGGPPVLNDFRAGLVNPWGMAFLPDGRIVVTERPGRMRIVSADGSSMSAALTGLPSVYAVGQGGLLDVAVDPDFATAPWLYWAYSESQGGLTGTALARGQLDSAGTALTNVQVIFRQSPKLDVTNNHYGARLVFADDKTLFVALGERMADNPSSPTSNFSQNLGTHLGKVVRINRDGTVPANNPFVGVSGVLPEIYSRGHRNVQGAALHPVSRELWVVEHGPQGGDEINRVVAQGNYGWPLRSYGCPYNSPVGAACRVGGGTHVPNYIEPLAFWEPTSTAPSGMLFYNGDKFPEWQNSVIVGALVDRCLWRFPLQGNNALGAREQLFGSLGERVRDVRQGPDGWVYLLIDSGSNGRIVRITR
jgi:aldose sugar dehydrogenase